MQRTLIRGAQVVLPDRVAETAVLIEGGKIVSVDAAADARADEVIDADGLVLFPGLVDDQVHFREPGLTHKETLATASAACAAGGVTSFLEMPNTVPAATSVAAVQAKYDLAAASSVVNYGFYIGATPSNIPELQNAAEANIPGIKIFIGSSTGDLLVDAQEALERIFAETELPICAHCEDEATIAANKQRIGTPQSVHDHSRIRNVEAAIVATRRSVELAIRYKHRFHVLHVSTADELPIVSAGKPYVTAEVCPHHLFFSTSDYDALGTRIQMNPSVKPPEHQGPLWEALRDGTLQVVATDHAPHTLEEKSAPYPKSPSGMPAVENYFALLLDAAESRGLSYTRLAEACCDAPARVWGLVGKGRIEPGYDADLVLVDPKRVRTIQDSEQWTKCGWSAWNGRQVKGWPVRTIVGGRTVYRLEPNDSRGRVDTSHRGARLTCDFRRGGYWSSIQR